VPFVCECDDPACARAVDLPLAEYEHANSTIESAANPPPTLGVLIGDVVHNLRSALDHLAWRPSAGSLRVSAWLLAEVGDGGSSCFCSPA
jgi:hypothetical protein